MMIGFHLFAQTSGNDFKDELGQIVRKLNGLNNSALNFDKFDIQQVNDSLINRIKSDIKNTHGQINLNYAYGLNTIFIDTSRTIGSVFTTVGYFNTGILGLPVNITFNYSTLKVPLGANNYFRISLDKNRLIEKQKDKLTKSITNIERQKKILTKKKAQLNGIMGYVEVLLAKYKHKIENQIKNQKQALQKRVEDSIRNKGSVLKDSVNEVKNSVSDSVPNIKKSEPKVSSINKANVTSEYQRYYSKLEEIHYRITSLTRKYDSISKLYDSTKSKLLSYKDAFSSQEYISENTKGNLLKSIKTFEIGLTYPKTTSISDQNIPIKGINTAFQIKKCYVSFSSGLTLNNVMFSTNIVQNDLEYKQNVFNQFDFQQMMNNGWLTSVKTGYGTPKGTHAFVGFNYLTNLHCLSRKQDVMLQETYDPAASVELDFRYVPTFYKGGTLDLVYGKTSMNKSLDSNSNAGVFESLFSNCASNLFKTRYSQEISKLRSRISISYRRIDPLANTTTFGIMQPNNQRILIETKHRISKYFNFGLSYRLDETIKMLEGQNFVKLSMVGANLNGSFSEHIHYSGFLKHVNSKMKKNSTTGFINGKSYLLGLTLNSDYHIKNVKCNAFLSYNDYLISDLLSINKYTQLSFIQMFRNDNYSLSVSYDYFYQHAYNISNGTNVFGVSGQFEFPKVKLLLGVKQAFSNDNTISTGGEIEVLWNINKYLNIGIKGERFVFGNFYRTYYRSQYERFPYLMSFKTTFKL